MFGSLGCCDEPTLDDGEIGVRQPTFNPRLQRPDARCGRLQPASTLVGQARLQNPAVGRVRLPFDQPCALKRGEDAVHGLRRGVADPGEVGAGRAWLAGEDAEDGVLRAGQPVVAEGVVHRAAEGVPGLTQEDATSTTLATPGTQLSRGRMDELVDGHYRAEETGDLAAIVAGFLPGAEHDVVGRPGPALHGGAEIEEF